MGCTDSSVRNGISPSWSTSGCTCTWAPLGTGSFNSGCKSLQDGRFLRNCGNTFLLCIHVFKVILTLWMGGGRIVANDGGATIFRFRGAALRSWCGVRKRAMVLDETAAAELA